jgi:hypothetical protein
MAAALVAGLCLAVSVVPADAGETCLKCRVKGFVKAHIDRDLDRALSYVTDDFTLHRGDPDLALDRAAFASMLEWEFATGTRLMYEELAWEGDTVTAVFRETNEFYPMVGLKGRKYNFTFRFAGDDIHELTVEPVACGCPTLEEKMDGFLQWARKNRESEIDRVYSGGRFTYDRESAEAWMELLREWRSRS